VVPEADVKQTEAGLVPASKDWFAAVQGAHILDWSVVR